MLDEFGDKIHEATPYRRQQAREQGQVVKSQDLAWALLLLSAILALWYFGRPLADFFGDVTREHLGQARLTLDARDASHTALLLGAGLARHLLPILGILLLAAVLVHVGQTGFLFLPQKLAADPQQISPLANLSRIFSLTSGVRFGFSLVKVALILSVAGSCLWQERVRLAGLADHSAAEIAGYLFDFVLWSSLKVAAALVVLALLDYGYSYWKYERDLRMTTQELREELKQQQGDPQIAARRKQVQRQLALHRLAIEVPRADVVVAHSPELAVALRYDEPRMSAPIVVAKGALRLAERICGLAREHKVPIVERHDLARVLYEQVEINRPIPAEQYAAVAELLSRVS